MRRWLTILQFAIVAAMFAAAIAVWPGAPDTLPVHWGINGYADRFGGKPEALLAMPLVALGVLGLLKLLPRIDPMRARYATFAVAYEVMVTAIIGFLATTYGLTLAVILGAPLNLTTVIVPLVGVLLIVIGAMLNRVQPNWFVGIRTPWTLTSERAWTATHRAGRWVFLAMGVVLVLAGVLQVRWWLYLAMLVCLAGIVGLVVYSYVVWRDDPGRLPHRLA